MSVCSCDAVLRVRSCVRRCCSQGPPTTAVQVSLGVAGPCSTHRGFPWVFASFPHPSPQTLSLLRCDESPPHLLPCVAFSPHSFHQALLPCVRDWNRRRETATPKPARPEDFSPPPAVLLCGERGDVWEGVTWLWCVRPAAGREGELAPQEGKTRFSSIYRNFLTWLQ